MSGATPSSETLRRYASALIDLAEEKSLLPKVEKDIADLAAMLESSEDLVAMAASPIISRDSKQAALAALGKKAKFQDVTIDFLNVLAQNGRLNALGKVLKTFAELLSEKRGEQRVKVQVAQDMTATQLKKLQDSLEKALGSAVSIDVQVKPDILGGMIVTVGSQMIDNSVAGKLERLHTQLKTSAHKDFVAGNDNPPKTTQTSTVKEAKVK